MILVEAGLQAGWWAASGAMALTGWPGSAPLLPEGAVAGRLDRIVEEIEVRTGRDGAPVRVDSASTLTARAAVLGLGRRGRVSANGSCRLLAAADGWVACNLARPDDLGAVGAVVGEPVRDGEVWEVLGRFVAGRRATDAVARARLLGIPAARLGRPDPSTATTVVHPRWARRAGRPMSGLRVVDLSSMWAGPLCARVLMAAGADVVKVESMHRPDGARATPAFYDWLHPATQAQVAVDFSTEAGRAELRGLVGTADVVIEGSRPRALNQLGVDPVSLADRPGRVWLSITGYGRDEPGCDWVSFGDDAAVAGGLVAWDCDSSPVFCADAIADPLTGLVGALAVLRAVAVGGGQLLDIALSRVAATMAARSSWGAKDPLQATASASGGWELSTDHGVVAVADAEARGPLVGLRHPFAKSGESQNRREVLVASPARSVQRRAGRPRR